MHACLRDGFILWVNIRNLACCATNHPRLDDRIRSLESLPTAN